jgi:hypothetical protein
LKIFYRSGIGKKRYAEIARLYGKNKPSIREVMKIQKKKIRARFYVAPRTANVRTKALDKYLMILEKDLQFWVENMHTKRVRVDDMLRQIALSL